MAQKASATRQLLDRKRHKKCLAPAILFSRRLIRGFAGGGEEGRAWKGGKRVKRGRTEERRNEDASMELRLAVKYTADGGFAAGRDREERRARQVDVERARWAAAGVEEEWADGNCCFISDSAKLAKTTALFAS